ncbi:MAG: ABC transporter ATP-binding protein [Rhodospirillales bacterium]|nr:ABC transporter ATP-binding protein [Rhodospirillales bacterium]
MEQNLFKYVWQHSKAEQAAILLLVAISMPFYFLSLDLPKQIVNQGIQGEGFAAEQTAQVFLAIYLPLAELLTGTPVKLFSGFALEQATLLIVLSCAFLGMVIVNGLFKLNINTRKGRMGERLLRRLRYELSDRVLRFPLPHLRRMKQAEVATMIKDEVEPLGGFIGDAFVTPVFLGGQALTALTFIMVQSVYLGAISLAIVLTQAWLIPRLRRRLLQLGKQRQLAARALAGRIGEIMDGATEMHANDTSNWERADLVSRLGHIFLIRFEIYQRKFFVKFLNNFLGQLTPFLFYLVGGLLALAGQLDIGALVAVIAAYKDLPGPIKELIDWDQQRLDVIIKYEQVIEQFQPGQMISPAAQEVHVDAVAPLTGTLAVNNLSLIGDDGTHRLQGVTFELPLEQHLAIVGDSNSGKERLAGILAGLEHPSGGSLRIAGKDLTALPEWVTGRRLGYVASDVYHFPLSVRDNLLYGLRHAPYSKTDAEIPDEDFKNREARRAGNPVLPLNYDWVDRSPLGDNEGEVLRKTLRSVGMEHDVFRFGIYGTIDPEEHPQLAADLLKARRRLSEKLEAEDLSDLVDRFDPDAYNCSSTLAENLLFGTANNPNLRGEALAQNRQVLQILAETGDGGKSLEEDLQEMGLSIARTTVELFADLPSGHPFFDQFSFIEADDLPEFEDLVAKADRSGLAGLAADEIARLTQLTFSYSESRHRLGLIDAAMEAKILAGRKALATQFTGDEITGDEMRALEPYDPEHYNAAAPILVNVLFGQIVHGQAEGESTLQFLMVQVLEELDLCGAVIEVGLGYDVGLGGKRLSPSQRQLLGLGRALIKDPDLLVVNDALGALDNAMQRSIMQQVRQHRAGRGIVWAMTRPQSAEGFGQVAVMSEGRMTAHGSFDELTGPGGALATEIGNA